MKTGMILGAALLAAGAAADGQDEVRTWRAEVGRPAPQFELRDTAGKTWSLRDLRGKTVVLEWFNPECPVVNAAHQGGPLQNLGNEASARDDTVWLAINSAAPGGQGAGLKKNREAIQSFELHYPVLLDESGWVGAAYGARTTPQMFVIDRKGVLRFDGHHDDVAAALADVWAGRPVARPLTKSHGCSVKYAAKADVGLVAPDFELPDCSGGDPVRLSDLRGRVVVLEWFNPQCPFVQRAHGPGGTLEGAAAAWAEKGVAWLAINSGAPGKQGTGAERNARAAAGFGMRHPVLLDEEGRVGQAFGARTTPEVFVLDPRGVVRYAGAPDDQAGTSYLDAALEAVLAGREVAVSKTKSYGCSVKYR